MISVISDYSRRIPYKDLLVLYEQRFLDKKTVFLDSSIAQSDVLLIDMIDLEDMMLLIQDIRCVNKATPIVVVINQSDYKKAQDVLVNTEGYGRIKLVYWHPWKEHHLLEVLQECTHPELPSYREEIAVVLPVFNEVERIHHVRHFLDQLKILKENGFPNMSIYMINDGSNDNTEEIINDYINEDNDNSEIVGYKTDMQQNVLKVNTRKAGTYMEAFGKIDADIFVYSDADDSFVIDDLAKMINILKEGYFDMIVGTKDASAKDRSALRRGISFIKRRLTGLFLPSNITDSQTGLKAFRRQVVNYMAPHLESKYGLAIDLKILFLAKKYQFRVYELPVSCIDREGSHINILKDSIRFVYSMLQILRDSKNVKIHMKRTTKDLGGHTYGKI